MQLFEEFLKDQGIDKESDIDLFKQVMANVQYNKRWREENILDYNSSGKLGS
jgi:hypothetical protein